MNNFIIIPAYNEGEKIVEVIQQVKNYADKIIIVDDGSTDNTVKLAEEQKVIVLKQKVNLGKGATLRTGCDYAIKLGAENLVVMDSDGQHNPDHIPNFLKSLENNDIVFGYRKMSSSMPAVLKWGNNFINRILTILCGIKMYDSQCGYRSFTADAYKKIKWKATDYYIETEMAIRVARSRLRYKQIPIETIYVDNYKGTTVLDGVKIVIKMVAQGLFG